MVIEVEQLWNFYFDVAPNKIRVIYICEQDLITKLRDGKLKLIRSRQWVQLIFLRDHTTLIVSNVFNSHLYRMRKIVVRKCNETL